MQNVERAALDRITGGTTVPAITDVAGVTAFTRRAQRLDRFTFAQLRVGTAMQLNEIDVICLQSVQTALDTLQNGIARPIRRALHAMGMAAFCEEEKFITPFAYGAPDHLLAVGVALSGIDNIQAGIECAAQKLVDCVLRSVFVTDLGTAETEHGDVHVGFAKLSLFHFCHVERSRDIFHCQMRDSSTPLRFAQNDRIVLPEPRSIRPIRFAFNVDIARFTSLWETTATMPIPMLKT